MKTIIAAVDFSAAASNAATYAAEMALAINADLLLLHVYSMPVSYLEIPVAFTEPDILQVPLNDLDEIKKKMIQKTNGKLKIETEVRMGFFFGEVKEVCDRIKPYAVVMGSQGTTAAERLWFGGHTVHAMKNLEWPIITVPPDVKFSSISKIALACDYDETMYTIPVDEIEKMVTDFNAELHIVNTGKKETSNPDELFESRLMHKMLATLKPKYHFITNENIDEGIMDFAEKNDIDLLIVVPKRHSLIDKLVHRSHTKQLVLHSHVPVLALHSNSL